MSLNTFIKPDCKIHSLIHLNLEMAFLPIPLLLLLLVGGIDVAMASSVNPFAHMTADHLMTLQHYCKANPPSDKDEAKLKAEDKQFNEAIKARHGKNAKKPTEAEIEKEETKAKKNVNYDLVVPRCCRIVNQNLKDKTTKKQLEKYISDAKENHKKELENHINGKVGKEKGKSPAPPHGNELFLACAPVTCTSNTHCVAEKADVDKKMQEIHNAKKTLSAHIKKSKKSSK